MTLNDLLRKANDVAKMFNSGEIKLMHGDQEVWFDLDVKAPRSITDNWTVKIVNYREGRE
ncbi:MAG: hypothetical protein J5658_03900 [Prevotella sp.]|nr:hypothetical protein [Prevotella sp.]